MMRMNKKPLLVVALACSMGFGLRAAVITQTVTFGVNAPVVSGVGVGADVQFAQKFDTSLGELESVDISIEGVLTVNEISPEIPSGQSGVFVPYNFLQSVELRFGPLNFLNVPTLILSGFNPGTSTIHALAYSVFYSTRIDAGTEAMSFAPVSVFSPPSGGNLAVVSATPPIGAANTRVEFEASTSGVPLLLVPQLNLATLGGVGLPNGGAGVNGIYRITYTYKEAAKPVPDAGFGTSIAFLALAPLFLARFMQNARKER